MLIAVKENGSDDAVKVDSVLATELIARAMNSYLDDGTFNIADVVRKPAGTIYKSYTGLDDREFFNIRHEQRITRDPLHRFDPVITYNAHNYILFDLDANRILAPDYYDHDNDHPLYATTELDSYYSAYKYASSHNTQHKPLVLAIEKGWFVASSEMEHKYLNDCLISANIKFREYKPKSEIMSLDWCFCCGTFDCKCTDEQLEEFSKDLPF